MARVLLTWVDCKVNFGTNSIVFFFFFRFLFLGLQIEWIHARRGSRAMLYVNDITLIDETEVRINSMLESWRGALE